jgi:hypothetical protein
MENDVADDVREATDSKPMDFPTSPLDLPPLGSTGVVGEVPTLAMFETTTTATATTAAAGGTTTTRATRTTQRSVNCD